MASTSDRDAHYRLGDAVPSSIPGHAIRHCDLSALDDDTEQQLLALWRRAFNGGPSWFFLGADPLDHLRWKARDFPGTCHVEFDEYEGERVGCILDRGHRYWVNGREIEVRAGVDWAMEPALQGRRLLSGYRGVRHHIVDLCPTAAFSLGPDAHPTSRRIRGVANVESRVVGNEVQTLALPLSLTAWIRARNRTRSAQLGASRTRSVLDQRRRRLVPSVSQLKLAARLAEARGRRLLDRPGRAWSGTIRDVERFDDRADAFWEQVRDSFDVIQIRDRAYLNWRFLDPRSGGFVTRVAEAPDGTMLGYYALRVAPSGATLADLLVLPDRDDVARALIEDATRRSRRTGSPVLRCWMAANHPYHPLLRSRGFVHYPNQMAVTFREWAWPASDTDFLADADTRLHFMTADSDHV